MKPQKIDMTGKRIGSLVVLHEEPAPERDWRKRIWWMCLCDCGNKKTILGSSLRRGHYKSCGCRRYDFAKGEKHGNWRGKKWIHRGYVYFSLESNGKQVLEHRHIMELHLGRELLKEEYIHHKNGIKTEQTSAETSAGMCKICTHYRFRTVSEYATFL